MDDVAGIIWQALAAGDGGLRAEQRRRQGGGGSHSPTSRLNLSRFCHCIDTSYRHGRQEVLRFSQKWTSVRPCKVVGHSALSPLVAAADGPLTAALAGLRGGVHPRAVGRCTFKLIDTHVESVLIQMLETNI